MSQTENRSSGNTLNDSNNHPQKQFIQYASRWDALPKKTKPRNRFSSSSSTRTNTFHTKSVSNSTSIAPGTGEQKLNHRRWNPRDKSEEHDLLSQYRILQTSCRNSLSTISVLQNHETKVWTDLLQFMIMHYETLSAEETSIVVVHDILLPALQSLLSSLNEPLHQDSRINTIAGTIKEILNVIRTLLSSRPHASAMLSPLTDIPISDDIKDNTATTNIWHETSLIQNDDTNRNPTRRKLWLVLQQHLPQTVECFTLCVQVTKQLDDNNNSLTPLTAATNNRKRDQNKIDNHLIHLDVPHVMQHLLDTFAKNTEPLVGCRLYDSTTAFQPTLLQEQGLNLLLALLEYKSTNKVITSSVSFIQSLIFPSYHTINDTHPSNGMACTYCGWHPPPTQSRFVTLLHDSEPTVVMQCATQMLQSMPLSLWLGSGTKRPKQLSTFQQNLIEALSNFTQIVSCKLKQQLLLATTNNESDAALPACIKAILTHIPFDNSINLIDKNNWSGLETLAVNIVDSMMFSALSSHDSVYQSIIRDCLRGHITTTGPLQRTSRPIEVWLQWHGCTFVREILSSELGIGPSLSALSMLYDLLRSYPDLFLRSDPVTTNIRDQQDKCIPLWSLLEIFLEQRTLADPDVVAQCIERLLLGRQSYMKEAVATHSTENISFDKMLDVLLPILESYITGQSVSDHVQGLACSSVSYFLSDDWNMVVHLSLSLDTVLPVGDRMLLLVQQILENCSYSGIGESLQVMCCKAIGNICTTFVPSRMVTGNYQTANPLVMKFFSVLNQLLSNQYAIATRCMAMFALGNLSHTIVTTPDTINLFIEGNLNVFVDLTELSLRAVSDRNEKYSTNAVRTTTYMIVLVLKCENRSSSCNNVGKQLLLNVINMLVDNIRSAISSESIVEAHQERQHSWKQRMAIRKQGWGSCNLLSFLLEHNILTELECVDGDTTLTQFVGTDVVASFVECFENINTIHEKVALSACVALRSIPDLSAFMSDTLFSRAMVACGMFLFGDESTECNLGLPNNKLRVEMELVLATIISNCTEASIIEALNVNNFVSNVHQLFQWMVRKGCSSKTFQMFATAFAMSESTIDIHVEQQFMNYSCSYDSAIQSDLLDEL